jgi:putative phage-type endonuclease
MPISIHESRPSDESIEDIVGANTPAEDREQWLLERNVTIGGSSVGAIIGVNHYKSAAEVYDDIWNPSSAQRANAGQQRRMDRGHMMEPVIAELYEADASRTLAGDGRTRWVHPRIPYLHATPDRRILEGERRTPPQGEAAGTTGDGVWECKCLGTHTFNETIQLGIDPSYYAQIQLYMAVLGLTWGSFAIFNAEEWRLYWFDVPRNDRFITRMERRVQHFWNVHVTARRRPETMDQITIAEPLLPPPHLGAEATVLDGMTEATQLFANLKMAHEARKLANDRYDRLVEEAKGSMRQLNIGKARVTGLGKINWVSGSRRTFDKDALAREHPEIDLERYARTSETQTFTFTPETRR